MTDTEDKQNDLSKIGFLDYRFTDREAASFILQDLDIEAQLVAINSVFENNKKIDQVESERIEKFKKHIESMQGIDADIGTDQLIDLFHDSVYRDAAHSMAAVGMLAPVIESLFYNAFMGIKKRASWKIRSEAQSHERWLSGQNDAWDCHFVWNRGNRSKNVVAGIIQLSQAVQIESFFPNDLQEVLEALFGYRNKMFHCGFEWPIEEREKFSNRIRLDPWPESWFASATSGDKPWVFYLTEEFVRHCLRTIDSVIEGFGKYANEQFLNRDESR